MLNWLRRVRRIGRAVMGRDLFVRRDLVCRTQRLGSDYGGWVIAADTLNRSSIVYSGGVGEDITFDLELIKAYGCVVHAFDPTPRSIEWVKKQSLPENFVLHEFGLADVDGSASFNLPENPTHVSHSMRRRPSTKWPTLQCPVRRVSTAMSQLGHTHIDLLKMDIEGAEYEVLEDLIISGIYPTQLLVEFHHRFPGIGSSKTKSALSLLRRAGYQLFFISESGEEYCFRIRQ